MSRMYSAVFEGVAVTAVQDLFEITAGNSSVIIHAVSITNDSDETSQQLPFSIKRVTGTVTSGSGGSVVTPAKLNSNSAAASSTVEANNTTRATGTIETIRRKSENVLNGAHWLFTPEERIVLSPSETMVVGLEAAPTASINLSGEMILEEI